jgi:hypothetical protein
MAGFDAFTVTDAVSYATQFLAFNEANIALQMLAALAIGGFVILSVVKWLQKE